MKAPDFAYVRPDTLDETFAALTEYGSDARILAGGQTLMPLQNLRMASDGVLIDINRLPGLSGIECEPEYLRIGALVRYAALEKSDLVKAHAPLIHEAVRHVAHPAIRNRGTVGGSLALGDPAAEMPACALALGAALELHSAAGLRTVPAEAFYLGLYETVLRPDEVLTAVRIPLPKPRQIYAFNEIARRRGDFALAGLAVTGERNGQSLQSIRLAFLGVADKPVLAKSAMAELEGQPLNGDTISRVRETVMNALDPPDDPAVPAEYRRHLSGVLTVRLLNQIRTDDS